MMLLAGSSSLFLILTNLNLSFMVSDVQRRYIVFSRLINPFSVHCNFDRIISLTLNDIRFMSYGIPVVLYIPLPALRRWWMRMLVQLSIREVSTAFIFEDTVLVSVNRVTLEVKSSSLYPPKKSIMNSQFFLNKCLKFVIICYYPISLSDHFNYNTSDISL